MMDMSSTTGFSASGSQGNLKWTFNFAILLQPHPQPHVRRLALGACGTEPGLRGTEPVNQDMVRTKPILRGTEPANQDMVRTEHGLRGAEPAMQDGGGM